MLRAVCPSASRIVRTAPAAYGGRCARRKERLRENAQAVMAAGDALTVAVPGEDVQGLLVVPFGGRVVSPDLSDLAEPVDQRRAASRAVVQAPEHVADQFGLAGYVAPCVQLRAHGLGQLAGWCDFTRLEQVIPGLEQIMNVGAALRPAASVPLPIPGSVAVRGGHLVLPVAGREDAM